MTDAERIEALGGPTKVAALLNLPKLGGVQRVSNWKARGIPATVKLSRPDLFLEHLPTAASRVIGTEGAPPIPQPDGGRLSPEEARDAA